MSESGKGSCGYCCCRFVFTLGLTCLFMWLSLRTSDPKCYLDRFYLPALNKSLDSPDNTTLYFALRLDNPNDDKGIFYDDLNVTFYDAPNKSHVIGTSVIPRFYQGHGKKAKKSGNVTINKTVNGSAVFAVDLATAVRFKILAWKTKRGRIKVGADVRVNDQGEKEFKKKIGLKSEAATKNTRNFMVVAALTNILVFIFLNFW